MTKIYVPLPEDKYIDLYLENNINGFFLGIEKYSINYNNYVKLDNLEKVVNLIKSKGKEVYISFNKLFYEKDINELKDIIKEISKLNIDGISFCDVGVYNIIKELGLNTNLIWDSYHLGTNYKTVNFWNKRGVKSAILSTEITKDEIIEIKQNTKSSIGVTLYGFLNIVTSSRSLLTNYFSFIKEDKKSDKYYMNDNNQNYPIVEKNKETNIFSSKVLNGIKYFPLFIDNKIDFIILNDYLIDPNKFYNVIDSFCAVKNAPSDKEFVDKLEEVVDVNSPCETYLGFLETETIYKVKKDE